MAVLQKLVFPMRDTMPHFVSSLRTVDEWKRMHAKRADAITQAEYDANANYVKSPFAKSLKHEDLHRYLEDSALDINFMVQLPSIEKCLEQWWELYAHERKWVDQNQLRTMYYDLAYVLVEAKTENIHKNAVSMILRSSWTKWSPKDPPLHQAEFYRLLFILGHLMTHTNRLDEYVTFFQETIAKIRHLYQSKAVRMQLRQQKPKARRKQSRVGVSGKYDDAASLQFLSSNGNPNHHSHALQIPSYHPPMSPSPESPPSQPVGTGVVRLPAHDVRVAVADEQTPDRFVELLDRSSRCQHIVVDPLLHDKRFQEKWKLPTNLDNTLASSNDVAVAQNPRTNRYFPPLLVSRVRTGAAAWDCCNSTPAIKYKPTSDKHEDTNARNETDGSSLHRSYSLNAMLKNASATHESNENEEILRRSLSRVTLKQRIEQNKKRQQQTANDASPENHRRSSDAHDKRQAPIYLAIST